MYSSDIPSGTKLPIAAAIRSLDRSWPYDWVLGYVVRFSRMLNGKRMFICSVPDLSGPGNAQLQGEVSEDNIAVVDMPVDDWGPHPRSVAP